MKKILAFVLSFLLIFAFSACSPERISPEKYVEAYIGVFYRYECTQENADILGRSVGMLEMDYNEIMYSNLEYMADLAGIDIYYEEPFYAAADVCEKIYSSAKYEIVSVKENGDRAEVEVKIYPIAVIEEVLDVLDEELADFHEANKDFDFFTASDEEFEEYATKYCFAACEVFNEKIEDMEYLEPVNVVILLEWNTDTGTWKSVDGSIYELDKHLVLLPGI